MVRTDMTVKLFRVTVSDTMKTTSIARSGSGASHMRNAKVGMGFAGYCFEAMAIIALFSRAMGADPRQIRIDRCRGPRTSLRSLSKLSVSFSPGHHNREAQRVDLMLFGFANEEPWIARVAHYPDRGVVTELSRPMNNDRIYTIGDAGGVAFEEGVEEVRVRIRNTAPRSPTTSLKINLNVTSRWRATTTQIRNI